jgi:hypothetical protein
VATTLSLVTLSTSPHSTKIKISFLFTAEGNLPNILALILASLLNYQDASTALSILMVRCSYCCSHGEEARWTQYVPP